jgi:16S rRNA processing protein RimM
LNLPKYIPIGYTKKAHGAEGELKIHIEEKYMEDFLSNKFIFLNVQNKPLPFFIEDIRLGKDTIVKLEEIDTPQKAKEITSSEVFLRQEDISEKIEVENKEFTYDQLVGFQLFDEERGELGTILEVQEMKYQDLLIVKHGEREVMIPLHEDLIVSVDPGAKKISLQLPEGLLDL